MKIIFFILIALTTFNGYAQNIGIGTTAPSGKLQINHRANSSNPSIAIFDSSTFVAGRIKFFNSGGNRHWQISTLVNNDLRSDQYMDIVTDSSFLMTLRGNGNVGINNLVPNYRLDVGGDVNLTGTLRVNGSPGNTGQVLTSNGAGDPQWRNTALSNTTRFYVVGNEGASVSSLFVITETRYNTNPSDITINSDHIIVNRSGLYHLEGCAFFGIIYTSATSLSTWASFRVIQYTGAPPLPPTAPSSGMFNKPMIQFSPASLSYYLTESFSLQVYITAGEKIYLKPSITAVTGLSSYNHLLEFRGHLISE